MNPPMSSIRKFVIFILFLNVLGSYRGLCQTNPSDAALGAREYEFELEVPFYQTMYAYAADQWSLETLQMVVDLTQSAQQKPSGITPLQIKNNLKFFYKGQSFAMLFNVQKEGAKKYSDKQMLAYFDSLLAETMAKTQRVLERRLQMVGVNSLSIECEDAVCRLRFSSDHPRAELLRLLQEPAKIGIWRVVGNNVKDRRALQLLTKISSSLRPTDSLRTDWLFRYIHLAKGIDGDFIEAPYVGYVSKSDTAYVNELFASAKELLVIPNAVKYMWSIKPLGNSSDLFPFYFLLQSSAGNAAIYGDCIADAKASTSEYGNHLDITVRTKKSAALRWHKLTKQVAEDQGFIAISIDDYVYVAPRVMSEIPNGMFVISLQTDAAYVKLTALMLRSGSLPLACNILNGK